MPVEAQRRLELASVQEVSQRFAEDTIPLFQRVRLLRIFPRFSQEAGDTDIGTARLRECHACC